MFLNRESLDQVSNSKTLFVFVLDSLMAEQQPENKSTLEETKVVSSCLQKLTFICTRSVRSKTLRKAF